MINRNEAEIMSSWVEKEIIVSIFSLAYNHEKYIAEALDGFLMQETSFPFEIIIHDDASTDRTKEIIEKYHKKYPHIIFPIYEEENQTQKGNNVSSFAMQYCHGKYIALCEGDDCWISKNKLQLQWEIMEKFDVSICFHTVQKVNEDGSVIGTTIPSQKRGSGQITIQDYLDNGLQLFQTSCYFLKSDIYKSYLANPPFFRRVADVGDLPICLYMLDQNNGYYIDAVMSSYRVGSIGAWSQRVTSNREKLIEHLSKMVNMIDAFDTYSHHKYNCHIDLHEGALLFSKREYESLLGKKYHDYLLKCKFFKRVYILIKAYQNKLCKVLFK